MTITFDKKLAELDAYLQMLIDQGETLDKRIDSAINETERDGLVLIKTNLQNLLASIKHAIVLLQIAKVSIKSDSASLADSDCSSKASKSSTKPSNSRATTSVVSRFEDQQSQYSPQPPARRQKGQSSSPLKQPAAAVRSLVSPTSTPSLPPKVHQVSPTTSTPSSSFQLEQKACPPSQSVSSASRLPLHSNGNESTQCNINNSSNGNGNAPADLDEDDTFYDAAEHGQQHNSQQPPPLSFQPDAQNENNNDIIIPGSIIERDHADTSIDLSTIKQGIEEETITTTTTTTTAIRSTMKGGSGSSNSKEISSASIDWDSMYDEEEEEIGSLEGQGSVIRHLLSQIRIGMDLTKVVLPTFILERRSLLEMYADFFAHPDLFSSIPDYETPEERMIQIVRWYLSAFHAGRKSSIAKKPYNPILGEIFLCHWEMSNEKTGGQQQQATGDKQLQQQDSSESPKISDIETFSKQLPKGSLLFIAEQVSHHPPVSAFYAENPEKEISCCAHIYTKSKYLGLSVGVHNIGQGVINVLRHDETYVCTFPSAYGRSILTVPWMELGGSVNITCEQTGYTANIEFATKPFYGGKKHRVTGEILRPNKEPFMNIDGEWNGCIDYKSPPNSREGKVFVDTTSLPVIKKQVRSISSQESFESRNVWKEVTRALKLHDINSATAAKSYIEQRQRDLLRERTEQGVEWETRYFVENHQAGLEDGGWSFAKPLAQRLKKE